MIDKLSHAVVYVTDLDRAKAFYIGKLGFELRGETRAGATRTLTVRAGQTGANLILMPVVANSFMDDESARALRVLVERGVLGAGIVQTSNCRETYATLRDRGVEFVSEPTERPDGIEAVFRDDSGNFICLREPPKR